MTREEIARSYKQLLKYATISRLESYHTLPAVLTTRHGYTGVRAAGLWLAQVYLGSMDDLRVMGLRAPSLLLFYVNGRNQVPRGTAVKLTENVPLWGVAEVMTRRRVEYLVLDSFYIRYREALLPLWQNPAMAPELGLMLLYSDPQGLYQIYTVQK
jgi:hypothetical protein